MPIRHYVNHRLIPIPNMQVNPRSVPVNPESLRRSRAELGLSQRELAKIAGYSERLIRKAESGGSLSMETIIHIAQALSRQGSQITPQQLVLDLLSIAKNWLYAFDTYGKEMVPHVQHYLSSDLVFVCPGNPSVAPFIGTWTGVAGLQRWLDLYFGVFRRLPLTDATFTVGDNSVNARFLEAGYIGDQLCGPIRINMHFHFNADGLIRRIDDDYDTQAGADAKAAADST